MRCRNPACEQAMGDVAWLYCPACGTYAAALCAIPGQRFDLPAVPKAFGTPPAPLIIPLSVDGHAPVDVEVALAGHPDWLSLAGPARFQVPAGQTYDLRLRATPPANLPPEVAATLQVRSGDGIRTRRWARQVWRQQGVLLTLSVPRPGRAFVVEELLVFNQSLQEQFLHVWNEGGTPVRLADIAVPDGFEVLTSDGRPLLPGNLAHWEVPPQADGRSEAARLTVRIAGARFAELMRQGLPGRALRLMTEGGDTFEVRLYAALQGATFALRPNLIIGVDLGTENTSIYYRDPLTNRVGPLLVDGDSRFPSYLYFDAADPQLRPVVGRAAKEMARVRSEAEGYLVRDVKVWLTSPHDEYAIRYGDSRLTNDFLVRRLLEFIRGQIDAFVEQRAEANPKIKYVFTLPVLDNGPRFREQRDRILAALREIYALELRQGRMSLDDFQFVSEPEAASMFFLLDPEAAPFKTQGFNDGDLIVTYDSGAGTTDIALVLVEEAHPRPSFRVLDTLGSRLALGNGGEGTGLARFGGRRVDEVVLDLMARAALGPQARDGATEERIAVQRDLLFRYARQRRLHPMLVDLVVEDCKKELDRQPETSLEGKLADFPAAADYRARRQDLEARLRPFLDEAMAQIERMLAAATPTRFERPPLRYVFAVGGNSRLPLVQQALRQQYGYRFVSVQEHAALQMEAVARGAVWRFNAPIANRVPYTLTWAPPGAPDEQHDTLYFENTTLAPLPQRAVTRIVDVDPILPTDLDVYAALEGRRYRVGRVRIFEPQSQRNREAPVGARPYRLEFCLQDNWDLTVHVRDEATSHTWQAVAYRLR
ncbi:MAG: Hsp70 family protein [Armatimonadetes bacterium]|nr:Hsp70 family protein [Armatimonadota bacterium]